MGIQFSGWESYHRGQSKQELQEELREALLELALDESARFGTSSHGPADFG